MHSALQKCKREALEIWEKIVYILYSYFYTNKIMSNDITNKIIKEIWTRYK